ncbi:MAG: UDP binding domain-containing protein [Planctomycetota bacterium]
MNVAFIGLGKLGFPCAVGLAMRGRTVWGYDTDAALVDGYRRGEVTPFEPGLADQYASCRERMHYAGSLREAIAKSEAILVAVPTPHAPMHDGSRPYDGVPRDFDNEPIRRCVADVARCLADLDDGVFRTVFIVSTVTPGTTIETLLPAMAEHAGDPAAPGANWGLVYNPFFIGQSTVVRNFLDPEFVLAGHAPDHRARARTERATEALYGSLHDKPIRNMGWTEAECVKLCYNTYLGLKVLFANGVMELCHKLDDCDCDVVNGALKLATDRLISTKYMDGGMADGGPCHGRDQMAMSFAARRAGIGFDVFDIINRGRDEQTAWLADLIEEHRRGRDVVLLGMAFKPGTNQTQGSPAILLARTLEARGVTPVLHDPVLAADAVLPATPALYFISTNWPTYAGHTFQRGDTVIDPWRMLSANDLPEGVEYVPIGIGPRSSAHAAAAIEPKTQSAMARG